MKKKILSILLSAIFVLSLVPSTMVAETIETEPMEPIPAENVYEKFHFYTGDYSYAAIEDSSDLAAAINSVKETAQAEVALAAGTATVEEEPITVTVEFDSGFNDTPEFQAFSQERYELETQEEVLNFRQRLNSFSKAYHRAEAQVNQQALADLGYETIDHIDYSPFFRLEMNAADIDMDEFVSMASSDNVLHVSFSQEGEEQYVSPTSVSAYDGETSWDSAMEAINASVVMGTYDGTGVRIGVCESGGFCNPSHPSLANIEIIQGLNAGETGYTESNHATFVVAIIATMAPEATFYVHQRRLTPNLEWFIDNCCDVVNCSYGVLPSGLQNGVDNSEGYIYTIDSVYDYLVTYHYFTIVVSSGNLDTATNTPFYNPNLTVTSPGNAFNVITVGGVVRTALDEDNMFFSLTHADDACYNRGADSPSVKPEISAMYELTVPGVGTATGTSLAAPQVTAAVALMIDKNPSYSMFPELIKAVLMATATETDDYVADVGNFDNRVGVGCLNVWEAVRHSSANYHSFQDQGSSSGQVLTRPVSLTAGREIQISLAWLVDVSEDYQTVYNTDYDVRIYSANMEDCLATSALVAVSNVEFIRFSVPSTGDYVIQVYRYGSTSDTKFLALAYDY